MRKRILCRIPASNTHFRSSHGSYRYSNVDHATEPSILTVFVQDLGKAGALESYPPPEAPRTTGTSLFPRTYGPMCTPAAIMPLAELETGIGRHCVTAAPWLIAPSLTTQVAGFYHPNQTGQAEYATLINQCLAGKLSC